jgi:hypothetical protein
MNQKMILTMAGFLVVGATSLVAGNTNVENVEQKGHYNTSHINNSTISSSVNVKNSSATIKNVKTDTRINRTTLRNTTIGAIVSVK